MNDSLGDSFRGANTQTIPNFNKWNCGKELNPNKYKNDDQRIVLPNQNKIVSETFNSPHILEFNSDHRIEADCDYKEKAANLIKQKDYLNAINWLNKGISMLFLKKINLNKLKMLIAYNC